MTTVLSLSLNPTQEEVFRQAGFVVTDPVFSGRCGATIEFAKQHKDKAEIGAEQRDFKELLEGWPTRWTAAVSMAAQMELKAEFRQKWAALQAAEHKLLCQTFDKAEKAEKKVEHLEAEAKKHGHHGDKVLEGFSTPQFIFGAVLALLLGVTLQGFFFDHSAALARQADEWQAKYEAEAALRKTASDNVEKWRLWHLALADKMAAADGNPWDKNKEDADQLINRVVGNLKVYRGYYHDFKPFTDKLKWYFLPELPFYDGEVDVARLVCPKDGDHRPQLFRYKSTNYPDYDGFEFIGVRCGKEFPDGVK